MKKLLLVALLLTIPACAKNPPPTAVASVADVGSKIEDTAHLIFTTAVAFNVNQVKAPNGTLLVPTPVVDRVALIVNKVGHVGIDLNAALTEYNADKAAKKDLTASKLLIQQAVNLVTSAMADIGKVLPAGTIQQIDSLIASVLSLAAQIKLGAGL